MEPRTRARASAEETQRERDNRRVACRAAAESIVLLENSGVLPMVPQKLALYGAGAGMTAKGGTGSGEVNERHSVSILEGLEKAGYTIATKKWLDDYRRSYRRALLKGLKSGALGEEDLRRCCRNVLSSILRNAPAAEATKAPARDPG
ncbi:Glycosyl hydrolase family 3 C-terminal domain-containing protein [Sporobacter termitidis DSM 10068]|uniref:Glycosyl hydrolase family 3 C-terminal domain-containing protein n=1 Tax=Sporobacter termitidis DSM 10068 TaxID=1123282 RepID=A0A1M5XJP9_9FIRM|nr:glycoside hydrolase family 3 C-terminal domain-containing protein [Sporobacter termitidis]SHH99493.1 Glycosyl hydrolase family 3 C-terminal domain-containing protein [Sporobacter termitidis DSM 10068]